MPAIKAKASSRPRRCRDRTERIYSHSSETVKKREEKPDHHAREIWMREERARIFFFAAVLPPARESDLARRRRRRQQQQKWRSSEKWQERILFKTGARFNKKLSIVTNMCKKKEEPQQCCNIAKANRLYFQQIFPFAEVLFHCPWSITLSPLLHA